MRLQRVYATQLFQSTKAQLPHWIHTNKSELCWLRGILSKSEQALHELPCSDRHVNGEIALFHSAHQPPCPFPRKPRLTLWHFDFLASRIQLLLSGISWHCAALCLSSRRTTNTIQTVCKVLVGFDLNTFCENRDLATRKSLCWASVAFYWMLTGATTCLTFFAVAA